MDARSPGPGRTGTSSAKRSSTPDRLVGIVRRLLPFVLALAAAACSPATATLQTTGGQAVVADAGAGRRGAAGVVVVGSVVTIRPTDHPPGQPAAELTAARNEFESFQVVVSAGSSALDAVRIELKTALHGPGGTIPAVNVTISREAYVDLEHSSDLEGGTGPWPDPLIPSVDPFYRERRNAFPVDVPAGENRTAWVDVLVPKRQAAGAYAG